MKGKEFFVDMREEIYFSYINDTSLINGEKVPCLYVAKTTELDPEFYEPNDEKEDAPDLVLVKYKSALLFVLIKENQMVDYFPIFKKDIIDSSEERSIKKFANSEDFNFYFFVIDHKTNFVLTAIQYGLREIDTVLEDGEIHNVRVYWRSSDILGQEFRYKRLKKLHSKLELKHHNRLIELLDEDKDDG